MDVFVVVEAELRRIQAEKHTERINGRLALPRERGGQHIVNAKACFDILVVESSIFYDYFCKKNIF